MSLLALQIGAGTQADTAIELVVSQLAWLVGVAVTAGGVSALAAMAYRWYVRERIQTGVAVLFGLTVVVLFYLGTTSALGQVIGGQDEVLALREVFRNIAGFAVAGMASFVGVRVGDRLGTDLFAATARQAVDADVSEIVQTVGRVTSVRLPEDIDDIVGYDPMPAATKATLANRRFLFPRRLTKDELRNRLVARLKTDYGVGHVDIELGKGGAVDYLAVGSRAAGIGPTLPPSTNAVAIQADPANAASAGDLVQVWEREPAKRVLTGELRGVAGDVVTVAIDAADTPKLDPNTRYKLVTLPVQDRSDREFASLLRAADETMGTATVEAGSSLNGATVGSVAVTVVAIARDDEPPETIPARDRLLSPGDTLYAIAKPDSLRRLQEATEAPDTPAQPATDAAETDAGESNGVAAEKADSVARDPAITDAEDEADAAANGDETPEAEGDEGPEINEPAEPEGADTDVVITEPDAVPDADDPLDPLRDDGDESDTESDDDTVEVWDPEERIDEEVDEDDIATDGEDGSAADDPEKPG